MSEAQIAQKVAELSLQGALGYVAQKGIDLSKGRYDRTREIIRSKFQEKDFAFVPDEDEAKKLQRLSNKPNYKRTEMLIPEYRNIDLIRTGLLIKDYLDDGESSHRVEEIKRDVLRRPNGDHLKNIVNLPTTPFFSMILDYLERLKVREDYTESQLEEKFEELVDEWEDNSKFVESKTKTKDIDSFCKAKVNNKDKMFLLGMKSAADKVEDVIGRLEENDFFTRNDYGKKITKENEGTEPRVEVMGWPQSEGIF